jgi:hypothetical protein
MSGFVGGKDSLIKRFPDSHLSSVSDSVYPPNSSPSRLLDIYSQGQAKGSPTDMLRTNGDRNEQAGPVKLF